jgi:hypothetical protein
MSDYYLNIEVHELVKTALPEGGYSVRSEPIHRTDSVPFVGTHKEVIDFVNFAVKHIGKLIYED